MAEEQSFKRNVAYKMRVGEILSGKIILDGERFKFLEVPGKQVVRINLVANVIDKYIQDGEKKYASVTLDDSTGQIKLKAFGDDIEKFSQLNQGDTIMVTGLLRTWNNEIYITPELIKKKEPAYLLVRKLEIEKEAPQIPDKAQLFELKDTESIENLKKLIPNEREENEKN